MKKLLLLAAIAVTVFACADKPETEIETNFLKGGTWRTVSYFIDYGDLYQLYFPDNVNVELSYSRQLDGTIKDTVIKDTVISAKYNIFLTNEYQQSFNIGFNNNNNDIITDTLYHFVSLWLSNDKYKNTIDLGSYTFDKQ